MTKQGFFKRVVAGGLSLAILGAVLASPALAVEETITNENLIDAILTQATATPAVAADATAALEEEAEASAAVEAPETSAAVEAPETSEVPASSAEPVLFETPAPQAEPATIATEDDTATSEDDTAADTIAYEVADGFLYFDPATGTITDADTTITSADIPSEIEGIAVTEIGASAFFECAALSSIDIPEGVATIGSYAFASCTSLSSISLPSAITSIESYAFYGCSNLTKITVPSSVTSIGNYAFARCAFESAGEIGGGYDLEFGWTQSIPSYAFYGCTSLSSVTIPSAITSIESYAFYGCSNLTKITVPSSVTSIGNYAFASCAFETAGPTGGGYDFEFGWTKSIPDYAFYSCSSLTSIEIPNTIVTVGRSAFESCTSLTSLEIPSSVTTIDYQAFHSCKSLSSITMPSSVTSIGSYAFSLCAVESAGPIGGGYDYEFGWTESIPSYAFAGCRSLTSIKLPSSLTSIGSYAFSWCISLTSVEISSAVTSIGSSAFKDCTSLSSVEIPTSVSFIWSAAFSDCTKLSTVYYAGSKTDWDAIFISSSNTYLTGATIYYNVDLSLVTQGEVVLDTNTHYIQVLTTDFTPITGASVSIDGVNYVTNMDGVVKYTFAFTEKTVVVSTDGYRDKALTYTLSAGSYQAFYLEADTNDGKPYVTMVADTQTGTDLSEMPLYLVEDAGELVYFKVLANWQDHTSGTFVLYQTSSGKSLTYTYNESTTYYKALGDVFEAGETIWLKLVSSDGTASTPIALNITISQISSASTSTDGFTLPSASGTVTDSATTAVFPSDYSLSIAALPIKVSSTYDAKTGYTTTKTTIGISDATGLFASEDSWSTYVKQIDKGLENDTSYSNLSSYVQMLGASSGSVTLVSKWASPKVNAVGYLEVKTDATGTIISQTGGLIVSVSGTYTHSQQFVVGPVPLYLKFTFTPSLSVSGEIVFTPTTNSSAFDGKLKASATVALEGGLGVSGLVTAGVSGSAALNMTVLPTSSGTATLQAGVKLYLVWLVDWNYTIAKVTYTLWGSSTSASAVSIVEEIINREESEALAISSRDYNQNTTAWSGAVVATVSEEGYSLSELQSWVMPYTMPELVEVNGQKMLIFTTDDADATTGNNVRLVYSLYDEATASWSAPQAVCEQATSDLYYELYVEDDLLYIAQQKVNGVLTQTEDATALLAELGSKTDVCVSVWDAESGSFTTRYVLEDATLDMYATLAFDGETLTAVWVSNSANDVTGSKGSYTIWKSDFVNGVWSVPTALYETTLYISELASGYCDGALEVFFALGTGEGVGNIYQVIDGSAQMVTGQGSDGTALSFQDGLFYWATNGTIDAYDPATQTLTSITAGDAQSIASSYTLASNGTDNAIVWLGTDDAEASVLYASMLGADGSFSNPIVLYTASNFDIQYMDVSLAADGTWDFILNTAAIQADASAEVETSIVYLTAQSLADVTVVYANVEETERTEAGMQPITLWVENNGQETLDALAVEVYDASLKTYYTQTVEVDIPVGECHEIEIEVDLSAITSETQLTVFAKAIGETQTQDNEANITVGGVDVSVSVSKTYVGDNVVFDITVQNNQAIASDITLAIYKGSTENEASETVLIEGLDNTEIYQYRLVLDCNKMNFGDDTALTYYFAVTAAEYDISASDNLAYATIYPPQEIGEGEADELVEIETVAVTGITLNTPTLTMEYSADGENTATLTATVAPANATSQAVTWTSSDSSIASVSDGVVTAYAAGTATITATTKDGDFVASTLVTITEQEVVLYQITLDYMDGSDTTAQITTNAAGQLETIPTPTRAGYTFVGWYAGMVASSTVNTDTVFTADTTLYAQWVVSYGTLGDIDGDETISVKDGIRMAQALENGDATLTQAEQVRADIDLDGTLSQNDFSMILTQVLTWVENDWNL